MRFHAKELDLLRDAAEATMTSSLKRVTVLRPSDGRGGYTETIAEATGWTPWRFPSAVTEYILAGGVAWASIESAQEDTTPQAYATCELTGGLGAFTKQLHTTGYGFADWIPAQAQINGIEVRTLIGADGGDVRTAIAQLVRLGGLIGVNQENLTQWPTDDILRVAGGEASLWGASSLTRYDVVQPDFGFAQSAIKTTGEARTVRLGYVQMRVNYTCADGEETVCRIAPMSAYERAAAGRVDSRKRYIVHAPHDFSAEPGDRLMVDDVDYEVEFVRTPRSPDEVVRAFEVYVVE